jgi:hypothetical protein
LFRPHYSWNTDKVVIKHQSINQILAGLTPPYNFHYCRLEVENLFNSIKYSTTCLNRIPLGLKNLFSLDRRFGLHMFKLQRHLQERIQGGGGRTRYVPPKIGENMIFGIKSWFFTQNTPKIFAPPSARCNFFKYAPSASLKSWSCPWFSRWDCKVCLF